MAAKFAEIYAHNDNANLAFLQEKAWCPVRTGDYGADCLHGRAVGRELVDLVQATENPALIGSTVRMIVEAGQWGAVEIGLCSVIGCQLV